MSTVATVKCSKPQGEYCRLHNPAPKGFVSAEDALRKAEQDFDKQSKSQSFAAFSSQPKSLFQDMDIQRCLPEGVPEHIADHIALSNAGLQHLDEFQRKAVAGYTSFAAGICNTVLLGQEYKYYEYAPLWREADSAPTDFLTAEDFADYMSTLDGVLAPRQEQHRVLYRGIPLYSKLHDEIGASVGKALRHGDVDGLMEGLQEFYKPGTVIKNETYLSTSLSANYAADRTTNSADTKEEQSWSYSARAKEVPAGILFELQTNAGLDVTGAARHNAYEREVALPRETYFKVVNVHLRPKVYDTVSGYDFKNSTEKEQETFTNIAAVVQMVEVDKYGREINHTKPHTPERSAHEVVFGKD